MTAPSPELFTGIVPFVAAARARSFRTAAKQLGLTPSAVSKAIGRLEAQLGVRLLHRTSRTVTLTDEGAAFLTGCEEAVDRVGAARDRVVDAQRAPRGRLVLSLPLILGRTTVIPALRTLLERHPGLSVHAGLTDRLVALPDENIDVAIRIGSPADSGLTMRRLRETRWVTVAAPSYLARHGTPGDPSQLAHHACLKFVLPSGVVREWLFAAPGRDATVVPTRARMTSDHGEALIDAAIAGIGVFQAHDYAVADAIARGALVEILAGHTAPGPPICLLVAPGRRGAPKVRAFVELAVELLQGV